MGVGVLLNFLKGQYVKTDVETDHDQTSPPPPPPRSPRQGKGIEGAEALNFSTCKSLYGLCLVYLVTRVEG